MKKICLIIAFLASCFALPIETLKDRLNKDLEPAMKIVSTNKSIAEKTTEIFNIIDVYFDYPLMARLVLGKDTYEKLTSSQQKEFQNSFVKRLKFSFSEKLNLYTNQKIYITNDEKPNPKRYFINSEIKNQQGEIFKVVFKFHQVKANDFLLYDIDIGGVSLIQTYRSQFADLKTTDFNVILDRLNAKNTLDK